MSSRRSSLELGKRGAGSGLAMVLFHHWVEAFAVLLLVIGFLVAVALRSSALVYVVVVLAGFYTGRLYFEKRRKQPILPTVYIASGFILGFTLGALNANRGLVIILYVASAGLSLYLHRAGFIHYTEPKGFMK